MVLWMCWIFLFEGDQKFSLSLVPAIKLFAKSANELIPPGSANPLRAGKFRNSFSCQIRVTWLT
jgi:hypothetical protein